MVQHGVSQGEISGDRGAAQPYVIHAGARALDLLDAFDRAGLQLSLAELTQRLGLPKSSVLRLLRTLESRGYLERVGDGAHYQLGLKLFEFGMRVAARLDVRQVGLPTLTRLRDACGETVNAAVLTSSYREIVYVVVLDSPHPLRLASRVGDRDPAHFTALGKAMLAHLPPGDVPAPAGHGRRSTGPLDLDRFGLELQVIRRAGLAIDNQENVAGVRCVGAPVFDHSGTVQAAISISGPSARLLDRRMPVLKEQVLGAAGEISRALGFRDGRGQQSDSGSVVEQE